MANTDLLTTKQVSEQYNIPEGTLRYYRSRNIGPASFSINSKRVLYRRTEVERWIATEEAKSLRGGVK